MELTEELKTVFTVVLYLLEKQEQTRNDDELLLGLAQEAREFQGLKPLASASVIRCRAYIQNDCKAFKPTSRKVRKQRKRREAAFHHAFGGGREDIEKTIRLQVEKQYIHMKEKSEKILKDIKYIIDNIDDKSEIAKLQTRFHLGDNNE